MTTGYSPHTTLTGAINQNGCRTVDFCFAFNEDGLRVDIYATIYYTMIDAMERVVIYAQPFSMCVESCSRLCDHKLTEVETARTRLLIGSVIRKWLGKIDDAITHDLCSPDRVTV
jgi:hypothetical protein